MWWWDGVNEQVLEGFAFGLVALLISCFMLFTANRRQSNSSKHPQLPGPRGLPLVGYIPFLGSDLRRTFKDLAAVYGPILKVRLGTKECVVVTSPSHAKEILRDQDVTFANRNLTVAGKFVGFGASDLSFYDYGPEWRKLKKIFVRQMLSSANLDATYYLREKQLKKMMSKTYRKVGEVVDVGELAFSTVFGVVTSMVWGDTVNSEDGDSSTDGFETEFRSVIAEFMHVLGQPNVSDFLPFLACLDLQGIRRKMKFVTDRIEKLFDLAILNHSDSENSTQIDFLGYLLQLTKLNDPAESLSLPQVKGILVDAIVGGMDTTAITVEWAMAELLKHPKIMKTVQEELTETVGLSDTVEEGHLPKLRYLNAVLKETLRLHPPVSLLLPHRSSEDTTVGGYAVPKNCVVFINAWAMHTDPNLWEDPLAFQPERFLNDSENSENFGNQFKYLPFGSGRRMCPGMNLAEKMSMSVLSSMLHSFEWKLPDGDVDVDLSDIFGLTLKKLNPTMGVPSPRLSRFELYSQE